MIQLAQFSGMIPHVLHLRLHDIIVFNNSLKNVEQKPPLLVKMTNDNVNLLANPFEMNCFDIFHP
jgi:hypothetical protein